MAGNHIDFSKIKYRFGVQDTDRETLKNILDSTGFFSQEEIDIGVIMVEDNLIKGADAEYEFIFAQYHGETIGVTSYAPAPCTNGFSYYIYWIAVEGKYRGNGLGKELLRITEDKIINSKAKRIYLETSGRAQYEPTRAFYLKRGYKIEAVLDDFYAPNDSKVIFLKLIQ